MNQLPFLCLQYSTKTACQYYKTIQSFVSKTCPAYEPSILIKNQVFSTKIVALEQYRSSLIDICVIILVIIFAVYLVKTKNIRNLRKLMTQNASIDKEKIIVALEIDDFLIKVSNRAHKGYLPIRYKQDTQKSIFESFFQRFGFGHYYKPLHLYIKIKQFLNAINCNQKIQLFLYTRINENIIQALLKQLQIQEYFPVHKRKFCPYVNLGILKHPIEIDSDTRRVVIITSNKSDYCPQDEKYFIALSSKNTAIILKQALWIIKKLVKGSKNIDNLHEELAELKVQLQQVNQCQA